MSQKRFYVPMCVNEFFDIIPGIHMHTHILINNKNKIKMPADNRHKFCVYKYRSEMIVIII